MAHLSQDQLRALDEAVKDGDEDRIFNACIAVGDAGVRRGIPTLLKLLRKDPRIRVKNGAALGLRELAANEAVSTLVKLIEDPAYRKTRGTFVYALQTMSWYSRFASSVAKLLVDQNYEVREMAAIALDDAERKMTREQKNQMLNDMLFWVMAKYQSLSRAPDEVRETLDAMIPFLMKKRALPAVASR